MLDSLTPNVGKKKKKKLENYHNTHIKLIFDKEDIDSSWFIGDFFS